MTETVRVNLPPGAAGSAVKARDWVTWSRYVLSWPPLISSFRVNPQCRLTGLRLRPVVRWLQAAEVLLSRFFWAHWQEPRWFVIHFHRWRNSPCAARSAGAASLRLTWWSQPLLPRFCVNIYLRRVGWGRKVASGCLAGLPTWSAASCGSRTRWEVCGRFSCVRAAQVWSVWAPAGKPVWP